MQDGIEEIGALIEDSVETFLGETHDATRLRAVYEGRSSLDRTRWAPLAAQGWLALQLPEDQGGSGLSTRQAGIVAQGLGRHAVPEPYIACGAMPALMAARLGVGSAWDAVRRGLLEGDHVVTLAWQEDPVTLDTSMAATQVRTDGDGWRIDGTKHGAVAASFVDSLLITATQDGVPTLWQVPRTAPGVTLDERVTSDGSTLARVQLGGVRLTPAAQLARGEAVPVALAAALDEATLLCCAQLEGITSQALGLTLAYLRTRVQFGRPIGSFQSMQHFAVDVRVQQSLALASYRHALQCHESAPGAASTRVAIAAAKARGSDAATLAGRFGVQAHGAIGYAAEAPIGLYLKSAIRLAAWLGNGSFHRRTLVEQTEVA